MAATAGVSSPSSLGDQGGLDAQPGDTSDCSCWVSPLKSAGRKDNGPPGPCAMGTASKCAREVLARKRGAKGVQFLFTLSILSFFADSDSVRSESAEGRGQRCSSAAVQPPHQRAEPDHQAERGRRRHPHQHHPCHGLT